MSAEARPSRSRCSAAASSAPRWRGCCARRRTSSRCGSARGSRSPASRCGGSSHPRPGIDRALLTTDAMGLATRPDIDIVVEVVGGIEPAHSRAAGRDEERGKSVVSANKALLAEHGEEIHAASRDFGADLYYEAAVAGAIPMLRPLRESLAGDTVHRVIGHRQRHHELHPRPDGLLRRRLQRVARGGAGARLRRARPDRRRGGVRRRRQGGDPGLARVPHPGHRGRRLPRGDHRGERGRHRLRQAARPDREAARDLRADRRRGRGPGAPGHDPADAPAGRGRRRLQRGVRRGEVGRPADVLRSRGGRHPDRERGPRRPRRGGPQPGGRHPRAPSCRPTRSCRCCRWATRSPGTTYRSTWRTARRARPGGRGVRPARRLHPGGPADQQGHRGAAHHRHPRGAGRRRSRRRSPSCRRCPSSGRWRA